MPFQCDEGGTEWLGKKILRERLREQFSPLASGLLQPGHPCQVCRASPPPSFLGEEGRERRSPDSGTASAGGRWKTKPLRWPSECFSGSGRCPERALPLDLSVPRKFKRCVGTTPGAGDVYDMWHRVPFVWACHACLYPRQTSAEAHVRESRAVGVVEERLQAGLDHAEHNNHCRQGS